MFYPVEMTTSIPFTMFHVDHRILHTGEVAT